MKRWVTNVVDANSKGSAFAKAYDDVNRIANGLSYQTLNIMVYPSDIDDDGTIISRLDGITAAVGVGDIIIFQYPSMCGTRFDSTFISRLKDRGARVVLFVHDVFAMFLSTDGVGYQDMSVFNQADLLISHGRKMSHWLREHGVTTPMVYKDLFDYLVDEPEAGVVNTIEKRLLISGNLLKSPFLETWDYETPIDAFGRINLVNAKGENHQMNLSAKVNYHGLLFNQSELLRNIPKNCFGLSWDANIMESPFPDTIFTGYYQNYTKYNNPHKVSLYLALGMPVIVWHEAAVAEIIERFHLGFTIYSLDEIDTRLKALTDENVLSMKESANAFSLLLRTGYFTRKAFIEAEEKLFLRRWEEI